MSVKVLSDGEIFNILNDATKFNKILELTYIPTQVTFDAKYPDLQYGSTQDVSFSAGDNTFILNIKINLASRRLYYNIVDDSGTYITRFLPVLNYPYNLCIAQTNISAEIYFWNNCIYEKIQDESE